jgi:A/G-specific adenine glycosylase
MVKSHSFPASAFQKKMLSFYDQKARILPWRVFAPEKQDPYKVWLSEIMLQQTTVATVQDYFKRFVKKWPNVKKLAAAPLEDVMKEWAGLGYYARARNLHKCAIIIATDYNGVFPVSYDELLKLPGIGPYTAAAIATIAFDAQKISVMDGNIERIISRVFSISNPLPKAKPYFREKADFLFSSVKRSGDFAQSLMDLGATICTPQNPDCKICPVKDFCSAKSLNIQNTLPRKEKKKEKPQREGFALWIENRAGEVLCERRSEDKMLGTMLGLPSSDWHLKPEKENPNQMTQQLKKLCKTSHFVADIYHSFSHFDLKLKLYQLKVNNWKDLPAILKTGSEYSWIKFSNSKTGFPSLYQKAFKIMRNFLILLTVCMGLWGGFLVQDAKASSNLTVMQAPTYEKTTPDRLALVFFRTGFLNPENEKVLDQFLMLSECDLYKKHFPDEFEWQKIRYSTKKFIKENLETFPKRFEFVQPILLDRYDFKEQIFPLIEEYQLKAITRIEISGNHIKPPQCVQDFSYDRTILPLDAIINFSKPLTIQGLRMKKEDVELYREYLANNKIDTEEGRPAYIRYRIEINSAGNLNSANTLNLFGTIEEITVFADPMLLLKLAEPSY